MGVEPFNIRFGVVPTHTHHRVSIRLLESRISPAHRGILRDLVTVPCVAVGSRPGSLANKSRVFATRDVVDPDREYLGDGHIVLWLLVVVLRRAHGEGARWYHDHFGTIAALAEFRAGRLRRNCSNRIGASCYFGSCCAP